MSRSTAWSIVYDVGKTYNDSLNCNLTVEIVPGDHVIDIRRVNSNERVS